MIAGALLSYNKSRDSRRPHAQREREHRSPQPPARGYTAESLSSRAAPALECLNSIAVKANLESLRILEELTTNDPSNFEFLKQTHLIYNKTGDIFLKQGKLADALAYYRKGVAYVDRMSMLNDNTQIAVLRSESNRKVGEAYLAIASGEDSAALLEARAHLFKAQEDLLNLRHKNELGKNYEHRLALIAADLDKTVPRKD